MAFSTGSDSHDQLRTSVMRLCHRLHDACPEAGSLKHFLLLIYRSMNDKPTPLISVIVAVFNGQATLQQCIESIARQSYKKMELIIVDGGSRDGTVDLLKANDDRIDYWVSEPDRGIFNAWNKGIAHARGEWICFIGADDFLWDSRVLERMAAYLEKLPADIRVAYGQVTRLGTDGKELYSEGQPWREAKKLFQQYMSLPHPAVMHRRSLFDRHGNFDETFRIAGDYELLLRELKEGEATFIPGIIVTGVRSGGISTRPENTIKALKEIYRAQRMHGRIFPGRFVLKSFANEWLRLAFWRVLGDRNARRLLDLRRRMRGLPPYWTKA
jgi:glycosyltransferase involved in cell wall biosynthesis